MVCVIYVGQECKRWVWHSLRIAILRFILAYGRMSKKWMVLKRVNSNIKNVKMDHKIFFDAKILIMCMLMP